MYQVSVSVRREMVRTQIQENWVFNNKIKTKMNENHPEGQKQANSLHSQDNTYTTKDNGSAQDYFHQEAI